MEQMDIQNERNSHQLCNKMTDLYEQKILCDITFSAYQNDNESCELCFIPAHRAILAMGSPVFHAMFLGNLACSRENLDQVIFISDITGRGLDNLFRFIYSNTIELDDLPLVVIAETMIAAKKYLVTDLENICWHYLTSIDTYYRPLDALKILCTIYSTHEEDLIEVCLSVLDLNFEKIVDTQDFLQIEPGILIRMISRSSLISPEVSIFRACLQWATFTRDYSVYEFQSAINESVFVDADLGLKIIKPYIRFQAMNYEELVKYVKPSGILSLDEWFTLLGCKQFGKSHPKFLANPRHFYELWTINEIMNVYDLSSEVETNEECVDVSLLGAIEFKANKRFALGGFRVFNVKESNNCDNSAPVPKLQMMLDCVSREEVIGEFSLDINPPSNSSNNLFIVNGKSTIDAFLPRAAIVCFPNLWYRVIINYSALRLPSAHFTRCLTSWKTPHNNFEIQFKTPEIKSTQSDSTVNNFPYASFLAGLLFRNIG